MPRRRPSAQDLRDALLDLLGKTVELKIPLLNQFHEEEQEIIRMTEEQYHVLDVLNRQRRAKICGFAGSGKTMLAAEKARRLGQRFDVLLTCFNRALAAQLKRQFKSQPRVKVMRFHEACEYFAQQASISLNNTDDDGYYKGELPAALKCALQSVPERFDAIIVDEGQDFEPEWWPLLTQLLRDPLQGFLYIFYDDNQRLYQRTLTFPIKQEPFVLTFNCRNTQNIHQIVTQFYQSEQTPEARGPMGEPVELVWCDSGDALYKSLDELLVRLTQGEHLPTEEIAVLTPFHKNVKKWIETPHRGPALSYQYPPPPGTVLATTIHAFKGLERSIVIVVGLDNPGLLTWKQADLDTLLYVGCSRAKHYLIALLNRQGNVQVHEAFAKARQKQEK